MNTGKRKLFIVTTDSCAGGELSVRIIAKSVLGAKQKFRREWEKKQYAIKRIDEVKYMQP